MSYGWLYVSGVSHKHVVISSLRSEYSHTVDIIVQPQFVVIVGHFSYCRPTFVVLLVSLYTILPITFIHH